MSLFQTGNFRLHSGATSRFKIDCDALTDEDTATLVEMIHASYCFKQVHSIPRGGDRLTAALKKYEDPEGHDLQRRWGTSRLWEHLLIDDVLTTGYSMCMTASKLIGAEVGVAFRTDIHGIVIFARDRPSHRWITPIFEGNYFFHD